MPQEDDLNVSEAGPYKVHTEGPPSDTHAFHNATPAPGERTVFGDNAPPPSRRPSISSDSNLPKIPVRNLNAEQTKESLDDDLTVPVVATGGVILLFALLAGALAIGMLLFGEEEEKVAPEPTVEEVEGIPVRKDLKNP